MALAIIAAQPLAAQAKQTNGNGASASAQAGTAPAAAPVNEKDLLIPDSGSAAAGSGQAATGGGQAAAGSAQPAPLRSAGVTTWDFIRMLLILAVVVAAIYVVFWLLRRGSGKRVQENDLIRILGSRGLAGNRALHLVEVGKSIYLVGASDGGVQLIAEVEDKESIDAVRLKAAEESPNARRSFAQALSEIFRPAKRPYTLRDGVGFLRGQRDRLKKL
jgi:flagellar protein FliO/FliZ